MGFGIPSTENIQEGKTYNNISEALTIIRGD
jgi:hypothetical protein